MTSTTLVEGDEHGQEQPHSSTRSSLSDHTSTLLNERFRRAPTVIPRSSAVTRQDIVASAEYIFYRYLSPMGNIAGVVENHEIYLPPPLRIHSFPLTDGQYPTSDAERASLARVPDMFHDQKEYCFGAMEQDVFPRFLRSRAFRTLIPLSMLVRSIVDPIVQFLQNPGTEVEGHVGETEIEKHVNEMDKVNPPASLPSSHSRLT